MISVLSKNILPASISLNLVIISIKVVFPEPETPLITVIFLALILREIFFSICGPALYLKLTFFNLISLFKDNLDGAKGVLIIITGSTDIKIQEIYEAVGIIAQYTDDKVEMIFGYIIDESLGETAEVTVVAAGFETKAKA